jgi:hypothetical protein
LQDSGQFPNNTLRMHCIVFALDYTMDHGIHGATPLEMLHAILLGMFKYMNECFFVQIGKTSQLADDINALAQKYGELLHRQSN